MIETSFTRLLGIQYPIMQAPMGSISSPELVAAVSNAGGMGMLALVGVLPDDMRAQIRAVRAQTDKPFGANLIVPLMFPEQLDLCIEERVPLVSFFWGDVAPYIAAVHAAGLKVMVQAGSVEEATAASGAGVDVIVAQGVEAGGHVRGTTASMVVIPAVVDAVRPLPAGDLRIRRPRAADRS